MTGLKSLWWTNILLQCWWLALTSFKTNPHIIWEREERRGAGKDGGERKRESPGRERDRERQGEKVSK